MKKLVIALIFGIVALVGMSAQADAACTGASPTWSCSADSASITALLNGASFVSGDTINVAAGTCTGCNFTLKKSVHLIGAGSASSTISGSIAFNATAAESTKVFEVAGFRFQGGGPYFNGTAPDILHPITSVKVHDNIITGASLRAVYFNDNLAGLVWGVFYNNQFSNNGLDISVIAGSTQSCFNTFTPPVYGSNQYMYFEDNTFTNTGNNFIYESGQCGRGVLRHNIINANDALQEIFDLHGEQSSGGWTVGSEFYENTLNLGNGNFRWMNHRGGPAVIMNNLLSKNSSDLNVTEYTAWGGNSICYNYPVGINAAEAYCSPINGGTCRESQVNNSFYYNNHTAAGAQNPPCIGCDDQGNSCGGGTHTTANYIQLNREYWTPTFGTEAALPGSCVADGNHFYGTTDTDKIYKCTSTNVWTIFYTPFPYPHTLRASGGGGGDTTPPTDPTALAVNPAQSTNTIVALTFTGSTDANPITYLVEDCSGSLSCVNFAQVTTTVGTTVNVTGLTPGTIYRFRVRATDGVNFSNYTNIVTWTTTSTGTTYYIDKDLPASSDSNPGTTEALPWKTLTKANATLSAGDTVFIKKSTTPYAAGTNNFVAPVNSGVATARITYQNFGTDVVNIQNGSFSVHLVGKNYITVKGLTFSNMDSHMILEGGSDFNIIDGNSFLGMRTMNSWSGSRVWQNSDHNVIKNNKFIGWGACEGGSDDGAVLDIGWEPQSLTDVDPNDGSEFNTFENNVISRGGHHTMGIFTRFNVIRGNFMYNDAWTAGKGNRTFYTVGFTATSGFNLIEGNRFGYSAPPCDQGGDLGVQFGTSNNIFRYNAIYYNNLGGMDLVVYNTATSNNRLYNNTIAGNACQTGCNPKYDPTGVNGYDSRYMAAFSINRYNAPTITGNAFKNNLYFSQLLDNGVNISVAGGPTLAQQTIAGNFDGDLSGNNPQFVNFTGTPPADKTDPTLPNFTYPGTSPAIDKGIALTTVSSGCSASTSSITLVDATYFSDGSWGTGGNIQADWISVGTVGNAVQINSIAGNVVALKNPISCANANNVWLYKNSTGAQVLFGAAPDVGIFEFPGDTTAPLPPTGVGVK